VSFVVVVFSGLSILGQYTVRRLLPVEPLKRNHEVAGFTFGVIGALLRAAARLRDRRRAGALRSR
jgi:hypothetical protein